VFEAPLSYDVQNFDDVILFYKYLNNNTIKSSIILVKPIKDYNMKLFHKTDNSCINSFVLNASETNKNNIIIKRATIKCVKKNYNIISDKVLFIDRDYTSQVEFLIDEDYYSLEKNNFENVLDSVKIN
jgi:hypothetical protein